MYGNLLSFFYLVAFALCFMLPLSLVITSFLKKKIFAYKEQPADGSGWLSGSIFGTQSSLFTFLSATLVAVLIAQRAKITDSAQKEANNLVAISHLVEDVSGSTIKGTVDYYVKKYVDHVIKNEWQFMGSKKHQWREGYSLIQNMKKDIVQIALNIQRNNPEEYEIFEKESNLTKQNIFERLLNRTRELSEQRTERLQSSRSYIPTYIWIFLIISGAMVLMSPGFYFVQRRAVYLFFSCIIAVVVSTTLVSLYFLRPHFSIGTENRTGTIKPKAFEEVLIHIQK
jgi:hypothetical protein